MESAQELYGITMAEEGVSKRFPSAWSNNEKKEDIMGIFDKLKSGLGKTRGGIGGKIASVLTGRKIDEEMFDELEEALIEADMGIATAMNLMDTLRQRVKTEKLRIPKP